MNKSHARDAEVKPFGEANAFLSLVCVPEGVRTGPGRAAFTRCPAAAPSLRGSGELFVCLFPRGFDCFRGVVTPSLEGGAPLVGKELIRDDFIIYSLVPLINQWAKGSPCATQLSHQMSSLPQPLTVPPPGLRARRQTPSDGAAPSSQAGLESVRSGTPVVIKPFIVRRTGGCWYTGHRLDEMV